MNSDWVCERHGAVAPFHLAAHPGPEAVKQATSHASVPLWSPLPLLPNWTLTGLGRAGDERSGTTATVVALSGPSPLGGPADLLLVAEEPGTGLGARYCGVEHLDPSAAIVGAPDARVEAAGHPTALWMCASADDRVAFVGEAAGVWIFAVLWPPAAELVLLEHLELRDLRREGDAVHALPYGAVSPKLALAL